MPTADLYAQSNLPAEATLRNPEYSGCSGASAQAGKLNSLLQVLNTVKEDTIKIKTLNALAVKFITSKPDTALVLAQRALELSRRFEILNPCWLQGLINPWHNIGYVYYMRSNYPAVLPSGRTMSGGHRASFAGGRGASVNNYKLYRMLIVALFSKYIAPRAQ